ncbi:MAG: TIR domain-containing protein [Candidatus Bathyarchaeia archaeon]|jgi:predicted nucleotide-binding protein
MGVDFGSLIIDLETLASSSKEDFSNEFWSDHETYLKTYNRILKDIQTLGFYKKEKPIEPVPYCDHSFGSGYSNEEKAKLREITNAAESLLRKARALLAPPVAYNRSGKVRSNQLFLVQGNDNQIKNDVTETLQNLELEPIILDETANGEQAFIEKIVEYNHVSFAVVILAVDEQAESPGKTVNQNVLFELGYLLGRFGKENVVAVYNKCKDFQMPNMHREVRWIEYKTGWNLELVKELKACNFDVDANKLSWL